MWKCVFSRVHPGCPALGAGPLSLSPARGRGRAALIRLERHKQLLGKRGARHISAGTSQGVHSFLGWGHVAPSPSLLLLRIYAEFFRFGETTAEPQRVGTGESQPVAPLPPQKCSSSTITFISTSFSSTMGSLEYLSPFFPGCVGCVFYC